MTNVCVVAYASFLADSANSINVGGGNFCPI
jgi:hypothetical protein